MNVRTKSILANIIYQLLIINKKLFIFFIKKIDLIHN
jgi:hypothetical protein